MAEASGAPILEAARLCKQFGELVAVDDVSFRLPPGRSLAIAGQSGSGKTTIARMLVGLERPTSGTITACGHDRSRPPRSAAERRRRGREVQIVFQDPYTSLDPRQSAESAVAEVLRLHHGWPSGRRRARVAELMDLVGLDARQSRALPRSLSGGQRQRAAIARALAAQPAILILDESVAALDTSAQAQVLNLLAGIRDETHVSYILISHDLAVVRQLADETIVLRHGAVVERGPTARVLDNPQHPYTQQLRASVPRPGWRPKRQGLSGLPASMLNLTEQMPSVTVWIFQRGLDVIIERRGKTRCGGDDPAKPGYGGDRQQHLGNFVLCPARRQGPASTPFQADRRRPNGHCCCDLKQRRGLGIQLRCLGQAESGPCPRKLLIKDRQPAQGLLESRRLVHLPPLAFEFQSNSGGGEFHPSDGGKD
jgi:ABC-type dipeptide/oligopeptide/nickel transport system ATPase subunit